MYRFKLEALLIHRRHQEDACQKELGQARRKLADKQEELGRKKRENRENIQKLQTKQKEGAGVSGIILYINYIQQLSKDIEDQTGRVQEAAKKVDQKRNELILIVKKRKTLEKLKDKEWQTYQQKMVQDERKLMDEIASTRYAGTMKPGV